MNIFIFHRDFRIEDNLGLAQLAKEEKEIYLLFILTKVQTKNNNYFSPRSFDALVYCLKQLNEKIHINIIQSETEATAIKGLLDQGNKINKIYTNLDYSPFAINRSKQMRELAKLNNFIYREFNDYSLVAPETIKTSQNSYYTVFTPFWNKLKLTFNNNDIPRYPVNQFFAEKVKASDLLFDITNLPSNDFNLPLTPEQVKKAIDSLDQDYQNQRDLLYLTNGTANISTALKFGVVSIRQCYLWSIEKFGNFDNPFARQLAWRDFYYQATFNAQLYQQWNFSDNWNKKMTIKWTNNSDWFEKWKKGETGFALVDAGMKQLNTTGIMHNRARMVCASFLVKNLQIDWRKGEQYFAQQLIDYDPIINQCSWQWVAGTGFDAQPFFRIFNPELQQKKFDPQLIYCDKFLDNHDLVEKIIDYKDSTKKALAIYDVK
ncbi:putative deoxyribodipyrimidine photolyase protein [Spiroplasma syrphidicola EA-1]|uniref:Putative deoxyribodipyrimidine photolyase protein n=1 Tax=Spiroplasma syrphidicola EA-1 TaxID=1276229 RepID=R4UE05_9MOLU|nr:deoxyribodipyrimidine photo-lyase [Spiroplasma syrphidicola]AGM26124.1 putative deoxyribodipyrimidine photolyase protein [Spiroplasma syrphidicola EA-1]